MPHVAGDYMGEHWLASFALLALLALSLGFASPPDWLLGGAGAGCRN